MQITFLQNLVSNRVFCFVLNFRIADDVVLLSESLQEISDMLLELSESRKVAGLKIRQRAGRGVSQSFNTEMS